MGSVDRTWSRRPRGGQPAPARQRSDQLAELVDAYLDDCRARHLMASTVAAYGKTLRTVLLPWCERRGISEFAELDQLALNDFIEELRARRGRMGAERISEATLAHYTAPVKAWMRWCVEAYGMAEAGRVRVPRLKKRPRRVLSREEVQGLEDAAWSERDKLLIRLMADCGLRVGELVRLRTVDLFQKQGKWFLRVHGKGDNDRDVPVPRLWPRLRRLARVRPGDATDHLFLALRRGHSGLHEGLTIGGAEQALLRASQAAGIERRMHPHLLRHSCITWLGSKGLSPFQISTIVGNFSHLDLYMHLAEEDAHAAMLRALQGE